MTDAGTSVPSPFWDPVGGARHRMFISPDPAQRAGYMTRLAASAGPLDEIWTNWLFLDECGHYHSDMPFLLEVVTGIARARGRGEGIFRPASGLPVLALILELPDCLPPGHWHSIEWVLMAGKWSGVSVTLVLRAAGDPRFRAQLAVLKPVRPGRAVGQLEGELL